MLKKKKKTEKTEIRLENFMPTLKYLKDLIWDFFYFFIYVIYKRPAFGVKIPI